MTNSERKRGFELIEGMNGTLPLRSTNGAAGYDFVASEQIVVPSLLMAYDTLTKNIDSLVNKLLEVSSDKMIGKIAKEIATAENMTSSGQFLRQIEKVKEILINNFQKVYEENIDELGPDIENPATKVEKVFSELLKQFKPVLVPTGVKSYMQQNEFLQLANRSSNPKNGLVLANGVGIIDSDYYNNENNEGHIMFQFINLTEDDVIIEVGQKIGQGIFLPFLLTDDDFVDNVRSGGFGSTGK